MKFLELQIKGFGKFQEQTISFEDGINVIYGKNETGKSTMHTFIRGMLFGIHPQRGRASKNDLYSKYEPWENSGTYEGSLRLEHQGTIYRIERRFQKNQKEFRIIDETLGKEVADGKGLLDELLCGLSETAYNNTISIGQLKCATDEGMVSELKNYIANMNTSGNMALNITKATDFLKSRRKEIGARQIPDAARSYTSLLGEIKSLEREIAAPEYENLIPSYQKMRTETQSQVETIQAEKEQLLQKSARGHQVLSENQFSTIEDIESYEEQTDESFQEYEELKDTLSHKGRKALTILPFILAAVFCALSVYFYYLGGQNPVSFYLNLAPLLVSAFLVGVAFLLCMISLSMILSSRSLKKKLEQSSQELQKAFGRHLGDPSVTKEAMEAFRGRMAEFKRLSSTIQQSEETIQRLNDEISSLQIRQNDFSQNIEKQQKNQWTLEKKLELLSNYKTQAEALRSTLAENDKISQELEAIDLAQETMTELSTSIRNSFGLHLNKTASDLIDGLTGGIYTSMSIDENLNAFMNTKTKLVPMEQVSGGTADQVYLALRLASAKLIQGSRTDSLPLVFDDSFVLYDDERLKNALKWLSSTYKGQILLFTCHQREAQMLTANQLPYHLITL